VIRLLVLFPAADGDAAPRIRAAARGLAGLQGLIVVKGSGRMEALSDRGELGPAVELGFETTESMRAAFGTDAWRRLAAAGTAGGPTLHAYHVDTLALGGAAARGLDTTDMDVGELEFMDLEPAEPISNELVLPSRGVPPEDDAAA
jgi:hypothetical protein